MWIDIYERYPLYKGSYLFKVQVSDSSKIMRLDYGYRDNPLILTSSRGKDHYFLLKEFKYTYPQAIIEWWEEPLASNDERIKTFKLKLKN